MSRTREEIHSSVRTSYAARALDQISCCDPSPVQIGYDPNELAELPDEAVMSLGCGNPVALAGIVEGEKVVDLGSGGGIDVFLAARKVGDRGRVIGVDMTPEMLERAETNAARLGLKNVEFRRGLIEELPVGDGEVDVIISNCVINLAPEKGPVFAEAFRVLRPGGRLVVSDLVTDGPLTDGVVEDPEAWASYIAGALPESEYLDTIRSVGFSNVRILKRDGRTPVSSITVEATHP